MGGREQPPPYATTEVTVIISDVNDETPTFKSNFYECEIAENAPKNTPLMFTGNSLPEVFDYDQVSYAPRKSSQMPKTYFE